MLTLRRGEIRDKYSGEVISEVTQDSRRDLRARIHKAFQAAEQAAAIARRLAAGRIMINEGPLYSDFSLPIGGIRDSGLNGSTDEIEEMAYTKRVHLAT